MCLRAGFLILKAFTTKKQAVYINYMKTVAISQKTRKQTIFAYIIICCIV